MLRQIAAGDSIQQAAATLLLAPKTVDFHLQNIYAEAGVSTRAGVTLRRPERPAARLIPGELPVRFRLPAARLLISRTNHRGTSHREGHMSEALDLAEKHVRAFNDRACNLAAEIYSPDLEVVEPGGTTRGIEAFLQHAQGFAAAFPDSRMEITPPSPAPAATPWSRAPTPHPHRAAGPPARAGAVHRAHPAPTYLPGLRGRRGPDCQQPRLLRPDDVRRPARSAARACPGELRSATSAAGPAAEQIRLLRRCAL